MILDKKKFRLILIISLFTFSFILSSCGSSEKQDKSLKLATPNSSDQTQATYICNKEIYGDKCDNLDDFILVKKDELQPEYIKSGSSIGGIKGTLLDVDSYKPCNLDGGIGCLTTETYKALNPSNHSSKIISTENILGVSGSFIVPSSEMVYKGTPYGINGSLKGTLGYCSGNDSGCYLRSYAEGEAGLGLKALDYDNLSSKSSYIKNGYTLVPGITGTQTECLSGGSDCYINGEGVKAVETSQLVAANIKHGVILGNVTGTYTGPDSECSGTSATGCIAVEEYPSVPLTLTASLLVSASINGSNGEIANCTSGGSLCYVDNTFKAAESSQLIAANIKNGVSIGGVSGGYPSSTYRLVTNTNTTDLVSSNFNSLMVSSSEFEWFDAVGNRYSGTGDSDIVATNLRNGISAFGVSGSYGDPLPETKGVGNDGALVLKKKDGTVLCFGNVSYGGDCSGVVGLENVIDIFSTNYGAFAALKEDGSVVTWGSSSYGGNSSTVASSLSSGVTNIFSANGAFAALKSDGSVITWGVSSYGGDSSSVSANLSSGVVNIFSNEYAFAALKEDGSVVTWGNSGAGGDSSSVASSLSSGVTNIFSASGAFAALKSDGSVVTWGSEYYGGDSSSVSSSLSSGVTNVFSNGYAFAAVKSDGSVVTWGWTDYGGDSSSVSLSLSSGVTKIFSTYYGAFAALKSDGSVVTWGSEYYGGDSSSVSLSLSSGVTNIVGNNSAFAALKSDGTVVVWGCDGAGGNPSESIKSQLTNVVNLFKVDPSSPEGGAFAVLKSDGTVVAWGDASYGGNTSNIREYTGSSSLTGITNIFSAGNFFIGVREDESYVVWGSY